MVVNNRLDSKKSTGDFSTPEQTIPATGIPGKDWEACMTMNRTWGFRSYDHDWKPTETLIHNLVDIASKGGNYLLNVGPTSEGVIPDPSVERLREVGAWMKANGEAIYGTTASPFEHLAWGRCTKKLARSSATLYLHVFDWPNDGRLVVPGLKNKVTSASLLANGKKLKTSVTDAGVVVEVPAAAPDKISSTVVLKILGELKIQQP
jgi:alpha-L-fucosidase